ncbi:MAG TPA: glycosyltransferase, partial [Bacilli bacterium]|nr:glycosyltransferase [Bacilli bacterium]
HYITKGHFDTASRKFAQYLTMFYCDKTVKELIVPTRKTYDLFKEKYNIQRTVHIIPTGIDVDRFHKENINIKDVETIKNELGLKKSDFVLLFIGRLGKEKNIDFILNNFKNLKKQIPTLKFVIVGAGPYLDTLKEIIDKENIENDVIFTGRVQYTQIPNYCHIADIFVTASTTETQGLTVIEAMSASKPVVCANDESFKLVITDGQDGLFFDNEKEYEHNILKLYKDKEFRERISIQAVLTSNRFGIEAYARSATEVYKIAISGYKSKSIIEKIKKIFKRK